VNATGESRRPGLGLLAVQSPADEQAVPKVGANDKATVWAEPLQGLALALIRAVSLDDVAAAVVAYGTVAAGAGCGHALLLDEAGRVGVSLFGGPAVPSRRLDDLGLDADAPWNEALREGRQLSFPSTQAFYRAYPSLEPRLALCTAGPVVTMPLVTVGEGCGAVTFGFDAPAPGTADTTADAPLAEIVTLAGQAAARAAVYASEHQSAELLQRAYLPAGLSSLDGLSLCSRYLPAGRPVAVGGDWYDVITLPGTEVGIIIGDVAGHGLQAASVMASLRAALRAFATVEAAPARMLARLNDYTCLFKPDAFATVFVAVFDPASVQLRYASAGHPPALLLDRAGATQVLSDALGPPLGIPGARYEPGERTFPAGASLITYTDGLIERRGEPIDARLAGLIRAVSACAGAAPDELCDRLLFEVLAGEELTDDVALLVATRHGPDT
jgi:hypothetical protein